MSEKKSNGMPQFARSQSGAALLVALVMLAVISLMGIANMQSSTLEMRMTNVAMSQKGAMALAESGMRAAMEELIGNTISTDIGDALISDTCTAGNCFNASCTNGLCFEGAYSSATATRWECTVAPAATERNAFWKDSSIWSTANKHKTVTIGTQEVKYIVEFLCFVDNNSGSFNQAGDPDAGYPYFRITALYDDDRTPVMLQELWVDESQ